MAKVIVRAGKIGGIILISILFIFLTFYALHVSSSAQNAIEPVLVESVGSESSQPAALNPDKLTETIAQLRSSCKYSQIKTLCGEILSKETSPDIALIASQALIETAIETRDDTAADTQTQTLLASFANHPNMSKTLCEIGDRWHTMRNFDNARRMYKEILDQFGDQPYSLWAIKNLATLAVQQRDAAAADAALEELATRYSFHPQIPLALCGVADAWRDAICYPDGPAKAEAVYRRVIDQFPTNPDSIWASKNLCLLYLEKLNNPAAARTAVTELLGRFGSNNQIAMAACDVADGWRRAKDFGMAGMLYEFILTNFPMADNAVWAAKNFCGLSIAQGEESAAVAMIDTFIADYAEHRQYTLALCAIGDEYRNARNPARAAEIYSRILEVHSDSPDSVWAAKNLSSLQIEQGDESAVQKTLDILLTTLATHPDAGTAANDIGDTCLRARKFDLAQSVHQRVIAAFPRSNAALWATQKIIRLAIYQSELLPEPPIKIPDDIMKAIDQFIADYSGYESLPIALISAGEVPWYHSGALRNEKKFPQTEAAAKRAIALWEIVVWRLPEHPTSTPDAAWMCGEAFAQFKDWSSAIDYFQMVVDRWPHFRLAGHCQYMVAHCFTWQLRSGQIDLQQSEPKIRAACRRVLDTYPDSVAVAASQLLLNDLDQGAVKGEMPQ